MAESLNIDIDIDLNDDTKIDNELFHFDNFEENEIELEDIDWDAVDFLEEEINLEFINEINVPTIPSSSEFIINKSTTSSIFQCKTCKKKYKKKLFFEKHVNVCGKLNYKDGFID